MASPIDPRMLAPFGTPPTGLGGRIRSIPDDFRVVELPAYPCDGQPGHLFVELTKRALDTEAALMQLARALGVPRAEMGLAGLKDRHAVTSQWISVPAQAAARLERFRHDAITLGPAHAHSHKLRRGHLRGNRFVIVVRELALPFADAHALACARLDELVRVGLRNAFGEQRFGHGGRNLDDGLAALRGRAPRGHKADLRVSAGQSGLFNLYLALRSERGLLDRVLLGDLLHKRSGGMFECREVEVDQARLDAGELVPTGPIYGSKLRWPSPDTPAHALELDVLERARVPLRKLEQLGRAVPGTRRDLRVWPEHASVDPEPAAALPELGLSEGLTLRFDLPAGSYATVLLTELGVSSSLTNAGE
jgi:tRNA pseudouridine13 synthase